MLFSCTFPVTIYGIVSKHPTKDSAAIKLKIQQERGTLNHLLQCLDGQRICHDERWVPSHNLWNDRLLWVQTHCYNPRRYILSGKERSQSTSSHEITQACQEKWDNLSGHNTREKLIGIRQQNGIHPTSRQSPARLRNRRPLGDDQDFRQPQPLHPPLPPVPTRSSTQIIDQESADQRAIKTMLTRLG